VIGKPVRERRRLFGQEVFYGVLDIEWAYKVELNSPQDTFKSPKAVEGLHTKVLGQDDLPARSPCNDLGSGKQIAQSVLLTLLGLKSSHCPDCISFKHKTLMESIGLGTTLGT
jgi:hypothetical protein